MAYYNQSLIDARDKTYQDTIDAYRKTLASSQTAQQGLMGQYNTLQHDVLSGIEGTDAAQREQIRRQYETAYGQQQQQLVSRGLGNTTVGANLQRGLISDRTQAESELSGRFAQLAAGYRSSIGLAGLGYAGHAQDAQQAINLAQAGYMGQTGLAQGQQALGYAGLDTQTRGQDINAQLSREQMANAQKLAEMENATRLQAASYGRGGGGGGGGYHTPSVSGSYGNYYSNSGYGGGGGLTYANQGYAPLGPYSGTTTLSYGPAVYGGGEPSGDYQSWYGNYA